MRAKIIAIAISSVLPALVTSCNQVMPPPCKVHCWEDRPEPADANMNNRFDGQCANFHGTPQNFFPPLPSTGFYLGNACTETQDEHDLIKGAIAKIKAEQPVPMAQLDAYENIVNQIVADAHAECKNHLTGNGVFNDIDPFTAGQQACTPITAETLCDLTDPLIS